MCSKTTLRNEGKRGTRRRFGPVATGWVAGVVAMVGLVGCPFLGPEPSGKADGEGIGSGAERRVTPAPAAGQQESDNARRTASGEPTGKAAAPNASRQQMGGRRQAAAATPPPGAKPDEKPPDAPIIEYSRDPKTVVIMMAWESGGEIEDWDPTPLLRIYGDGRVDVKGRWESRLSEKEMTELLVSLSEKGVMDFDAAATDRELDRIDMARGRPFNERFTVWAESTVEADAVPLIIEICLDAYRPAGIDGPVTTGFQKRIRRYVVQSAAIAFPNVKAVTGLAAAQRELMEIVERTMAQGHTTDEEE